MAERLNATVLKTVEGDEPSGGSNPSLSANKILPSGGIFLFLPIFKNSHIWVSYQLRYAYHFQEFFYNIEPPIPSYGNALQIISEIIFL